jgi:hypothetical protein
MRSETADKIEQAIETAFQWGGYGLCAGIASAMFLSEALRFGDQLAVCVVAVASISAGTMGFCKVMAEPDYPGPLSSDDEK